MVEDNAKKTKRRFRILRVTTCILRERFGILYCIHASTMVDQAISHRCSTGKLGFVDERHTFPLVTLLPSDKPSFHNTLPRSYTRQRSTCPLKSLGPTQSCIHLILTFDSPAQASSSMGFSSPVPLLFGLPLPFFSHSLSLSRSRIAISTSSAPIASFLAARASLLTSYSWRCFASQWSAAWVAAVGVSVS